MKARTYWLLYAGITVLLLVGTWQVSLVHAPAALPALMGVVAAESGAAALAYALIRQGLAHNPRGFMQAVMGGSMLKLLVSLLGLLAVGLLQRHALEPAVAALAVAYLAQTTLAVVALLANLRAVSPHAP